MQGKWCVWATAASAAALGGGAWRRAWRPRHVVQRILHNSITCRNSSQQHHCSDQACADSHACCRHAGGQRSREAQRRWCRRWRRAWRAAANVWTLMHTVQLDSRIPTSAGQSKRSLHPGRRPSSARDALGGAGSEFGALKPSLKRIKSTSVLAGGPRAPSLAPSRHRRQLRSHPLPRMASFGSDVSLDGLAGGAPHGRPQVRMRPSGADTERRRPAQPKHVVCLQAGALCMSACDAGVDVSVLFQRPSSGRAHERTLWVQSAEYMRFIFSCCM